MGGYFRNIIGIFVRLLCLILKSEILDILPPPTPPLAGLLGDLSVCLRMRERSRFKWTDCRMLDLFHDTYCWLRATWSWGWEAEEEYMKWTQLLFSVTRNSSSLFFWVYPWKYSPPSSSRMIVIIGIGWRSVPGIRRRRGRFFCAQNGNIKSWIIWITKLNHFQPWNWRSLVRNLPNRCVIQNHSWTITFLQIVVELLLRSDQNCQTLAWFDCLSPFSWSSAADFISYFVFTCQIKAAIPFDYFLWVCIFLATMTRQSWWMRVVLLFTS